MIAVFLRELARRLPLVALAGVGFYFLDPALHDHARAPGGVHDRLREAREMAGSVANLASLSMLVLLAGFISAERRRGWYRLHFSHPTSPLAYFGLKWLLALGVSLAAAAIWLPAVQLVAWGRVEGGWGGLFLALLSATVYGGLLALLSAVVRQGEGWVVLLLYAASLLWLGVTAGLGAEPLTPLLRDLVTLLLPPQLALQDVYQGLLAGGVEWGAAVFVAGYGAAGLLGAGLLVRLREWG